jgi:ABC-2 type transport system permease protein
MTKAGFTARGIQLSAIAWVRWRLFVNSLRSVRGKLDLVSRLIVSFGFATVGLGGAAGMGTAAFFFLSEGKPGLLVALLWPIFFFWQVFPIMATAFTNNPDSSDLLRFPLNYGSYFLVRLAYGAADPATALGSLWSFGILVGVGLAKPGLLPWTLLVLLAFAAFNLVFMQMTFAWIERWLARRRTREVIGILFLLLLLSVQLIAPLTGYFTKRSRPEAHRFAELLIQGQKILPPGLAARAIAQVAFSHFGAGLYSLGLLCAFVLAIGYCLHVRLLAQYRGESLSESSARPVLPADRRLRLGWNLFGFASPVAAVFEKEIRSLLRSGPMLLTLIMPLFMLIIFRFGPMNSARQAGTAVPGHSPGLAFPAAAAFALLTLTNLVYNNFGGDGSGIQFFYACPVRFRDVVLGKNVTHASILVMETAVVWVAVISLYGKPAVSITIATLIGLLFAAAVNLSVGNVLSIYSPKKFDHSTFGRQRASQITVLISMGVQVLVVGTAGSAFWMARQYGNSWVANLILLLLAVIAFYVYRAVLRHIDRVAQKHQEMLVAELCRA